MAGRMADPMSLNPQLAEHDPATGTVDLGRPELVFLLDAAGVLQVVNPHPVSPLPAGAVAGTSVGDWLSKDSGCRSALARAMAGEACSQTLPAADQWFALQILPLKDQVGRVRQVAVLASDITAIKQAERHLLQVLDQAPEGVAVHDGQRLVYANDVSLAILGYRDLAEAARVPLIDLVHPEDRLTVAARLEAVFRTGQGQPWQEERLLRRDGRVVTVEIATVPAHYGGKPAVLMLSRDLTERKDAESKLQQSQRTLATLMSNLPGMVYRCDIDPDWSMTFVSEGATALTGYRPNDLIGSRTVAYGELIHPEDAPVVWEAIVMAVSHGRPFQIAYRIRHASGQERWVFEQGRAIVLAEGALPVLEGFVTDITERKLAEQERDRLLIREQEARAQAEAAQRRSAFLAEAGRQLVNLLDYDAALAGVVRMGIPTLGDWSLVALREPGGAIRCRAAAHVDPDRQELAQRLVGQAPLSSSPQGIARVMETGEPLLVAEVPPVLGAAWRPNDTEPLARLAEVIWTLGVRSYMAVPLTSRGQTFGVMAFGATEMRFGPDELALAVEFADRVAPTLDNARLYLEARRAVQVRDEFLSIASHELKTPLTSLQLAVQTMMGAYRQGGLAELPPAMLALLLERTDKQIKRMSRLVAALLDVSRLQAGQLQLQLAPVDLVAVVQDVLGELRDALALSGSVCRIDAPKQAVGRWDRARLEQVVTNLLGNAVKYGEGKPIEVTIEHEPLVTRLIVQDHGIGIPVTSLDKIFERFERAVSARHYGGLGLGLFIAKQIVTALGGSIVATNGPERGATFIVTLPNHGPTTVPQQTGDRE